MTDYENYYQVKEKNPLHKYRHEIPNIVDELGLDPYAYRLYCHYKKVAGDGGQCFESKSTMEKKLKMSSTTIKDRNHVLSQPFEELGGKPLITITQRRGSKNEGLPPLIEIVDIWTENFKILSNRFSDTPPPSPNVVPPVAKRRTPRRQTSVKKNHIEEEPKRTTQDVVVFSGDLGELDSLNLPNDTKVWLATKHPEKIPKLAKLVKQWKNRESDLKAVHVIINRWDTWEYNPSEEEYKSNNISFLKKSGFRDLQTIKNHNICIGKRADGEYIEFVCGRRFDIFFVSDKDFIKKLTEYAKRRLGIELKE